MDWNKDHIRETMLLLETAALHSARENYLDYVSTARLDRSEPIENDELAQAEVASDFAKRSMTRSMTTPINSKSSGRSISAPSWPSTKALSSSCPAATL
jgi:hypothetical protein